MTRARRWQAQQHRATLRYSTLKYSTQRRLTGGRSSRWPALAAAVAATVALLTGCASIPTGSAPQPVQTFNRQAPTSALPTPESDMDPESLARAFLRAGADPSDAHAHARAFLTDAAAKQWDDRGDTLILDEVSVLIDERTDTSVKMRIIADNTGVLAVNGQLSPANGRVETTITMTRTQGGWRIDGALPAGTMLDRRQFESSYRLSMLYFADSQGTRVVPDPRWFYLGQYEPSDLLSRLIAGPSQDLTGAVVNAIPDGVALRSVAAAERGPGLSIDFAELGPLSDAQRTALAAQVVWTLHGADVAGPFTITEAGAPLVSGRAPQWRLSDVESFDPAGPKRSTQFDIIRGGSLLSVDGGRTSPVAGPLGTDGHLTAAAVSADGTRVAAVGREANSPRLTLRVGPFGGDATAITGGGIITRPSFGGDPRTVWAVVDGRPTRWEFTDAGVHPAVADIAAVTAMAKGPITALQVSPGGARAALVVGGQVLFASVVARPDGGVALSSPRIGAYNLGTNSTDIDWASPTTVMVARNTPEAPVAQMTINGLPAVGLLSGNLTPPLRAIAADATTVYVADSRGVLRLGSTNGQPDRSWAEVPGAMTPDALPVVPD